MSPARASVTVRPVSAFRGTITVPGDKSISHRYALIAALARGRSIIGNYAPGADCASTLDCLRALGVRIERPDATSVAVDGRGLRGLERPGDPLDTRNSGTTMRLLAGILAAHPFESVLVGDESLSRRPMRRVIEPLARMGADLSAAEGDRPPLRIRGGALHGIDYALPVPSAQVKSAVMLAGLQAADTTIVREQVPTRDHTERALAAFGVRLKTDAGVVFVDGMQQPEARELRVPGDLSSAAFFGIAAAAIAESSVTIDGVGLNPTRVGWLDVLRRAGARVQIDVRGANGGEPHGSITIGRGDLGELTIAEREVPSVIDELPALAAMATHGGSITVTGASELRKKESDRITMLVAGLRALGADAQELPDGFVVHGHGAIAGGIADAAGDHRLAMAFAIAALGGRAPSTITGAEAVAVSYPGFFDALEGLRA